MRQFTKILKKLMKIFDCTTFYSEHLMMDIRFNILNEFVDKFIVCESTISHSGKKKKLNFDLNNYPRGRQAIDFTEKVSDYYLLLGAYTCLQN